MEHSNPAIIILLILFIGPVLHFIRRAKHGEEIYIRRIPGIDAIDDTVGRAIELGRPISFTTALTGIGPLFYACLGVLKHIARRVSRFNAQLFVPCGDPESLVLADATVQSAYQSEKREALYDPNSLRYLSSEQFAFSSGYMGLIQRQNVGGAFLFGNFAAESLILAEAAERIGAVQVAATTDTSQIPFFITVCDYTLLGEELFAAGAYLSRDPVQIGSLRGQDFAKLILALIVCLGILEGTYNAYAPRAKGQSPRVQAAFSASWEDLGKYLPFREANEQPNDGSNDGSSEKK